MYVSPNFKTKKALKEAVRLNKTVTVFEPGIGTAPLNGRAVVEGPHFPEPHKWYAEVMIKNGRVVNVK